MEYSEISFSFESYKDYGSNKIDYNSMFKDIVAFLTIAFNNDYQLKVWKEDGGIIIQYNHLDENMCGYRLEWVSEDEYVVKEEEAVNRGRPPAKESDSTPLVDITAKFLDGDDIDENNL